MFNPISKLVFYFGLLGFLILYVTKGVTDYGTCGTKSKFDVPESFSISDLHSWVFVYLAAWFLTGFILNHFYKKYFTIKSN